MIKIAGIWEQGWNTPFLEYDLWEYPLRDFGVDAHYMCPVSGIDKPVIERKDIQEILNENKDLTIVWIDEKGDTLLSDFVHPKNALYIMGRTTYSPMAGLKKEADKSVRIATRKDNSNGGMLWSHQAICLVLYDRLNK